MPGDAFRATSRRAKAMATSRCPRAGPASGRRPARSIPPNITPDRETGIGAWSEADFVNAVQHGISPQGTHYIPAFPYASYGRMNVEDVLDLKGYLMSLPAVKAERHPPEVLLGPIGTPLARRITGLWKLLALKQRRINYHADETEAWNRGHYLVNAPGHCSECHTPRNLLMVPITAEKFTGGPHPDGKGKVPSLYDLVERKRYKDADDLAAALQFGETFGYDHVSSGGMGADPDQPVEAAGERYQGDCRLSGELEVRPDPIPRPLSAAVRDRAGASPS